MLQALKEELEWLEREHKDIADQYHACRRAKGLTSCDDCESCVPKHCGLLNDLRRNRKAYAAAVLAMNTQEAAECSNDFPKRK